ncbi:MAG: hypothetical protein CMJ77_14465 [Planctomycetaceae bacterium]|nr:hypothetical protein [Planctomycetaceae bacterium]
MKATKAHFLSGIRPLLPIAAHAPQDLTPTFASQIDKSSINPSIQAKRPRCHGWNNRKWPSSLKNPKHPVNHPRTKA